AHETDGVCGEADQQVDRNAQELLVLRAGLPDTQAEGGGADQGRIDAVLDDVVSLLDRLLVLVPERLDLISELLHLLEREIHHRIGSSPAAPSAAALSAPPRGIRCLMPPQCPRPPWRAGIEALAVP